jgi:hypothetical protein
MKTYLQSEHWKAVPWLVGLLLAVDIVGRGHAELGELIVFGVGLFVVCAVAIGADVFLGQFRPRRRRF